ncbi:MAG: hypothetical protein APF76_04845 [Desulfitibacter sp. BRH_c19]|nr:MAG: hypothetical protein APF76_04845 [Desulfitibacter sp. BRH_c19]
MYRAVTQRFFRISFRRFILLLFRRFYGSKYFDYKEIKLKKEFFNARLDYKKRDLYYYLPKLILPIIIAVLMFGILTTNLNLRRAEVLADFNFGVDSNSKVSLFGITSDESQALKSKETYLMKYIFNNIDSSQYNNLNHSDRIEYVSDIIALQYDLDDDTELYLTAEKAIAKYYVLNSIGYGVNHIFSILLSLILGFFAVDLILFLLKQWYISVIADENEKLEMLTVLVGENINSTTEDILNVLISNSVVFKPYLQSISREYYSDNTKALLMLNNVPYAQFRMLAKTLISYRKANKDKAIANLKRHLERKKKRQMNKEEFLINVKTYIALGLMIPPCLCLLLLWFYPLLIIFSNLTF